MIKLNKDPSKELEIIIQDIKKEKEYYKYPRMISILAKGGLFEKAFELAEQITDSKSRRETFTDLACIINEYSKNL
jgi:hypothetical protein